MPVRGFGDVRSSTREGRSNDFKCSNTQQTRPAETLDPRMNVYFSGREDASDHIKLDY
jgi:hypothetical protein